MRVMDGASRGMSRQGRAHCQSWPWQSAVTRMVNRQNTNFDKGTDGWFWMHLGSRGRDARVLKSTLPQRGHSAMPSIARSKQQAGVAVGIEAVAVGNCMRVGARHGVQA